MAVLSRLVAASGRGERRRPIGRLLSHGFGIMGGHAAGGPTLMRRDPKRQQPRSTSLSPIRSIPILRYVIAANWSLISSLVVEENCPAIATSTAFATTVLVTGVIPSSTLSTVDAFSRGGRYGLMRSTPPVCRFLLHHFSSSGHATAGQVVVVFTERSAILARVSTASPPFFGAVSIFPVISNVRFSSRRRHIS